METYPEFPIVILDADGVVDRVADEDEAEAYIVSMPGSDLRWEREHDALDANRNAISPARGVTQG